MGWFRSNRGIAAWAAFFALACQLLLSFGHVHVGKLSGGSAAWVRGQLLRALSSNAIRGALERRFGVVLAFQNCHRLAAFRPETVGGEQYRRFVSVEGQVLNQQPEFVDC